MQNWRGCLRDGLPVAIPKRRYLDWLVRPPIARASCLRVGLDLISGRSEHWRVTNSPSPPRLLTDDADPRS